MQYETSHPRIIIIKSPSFRCSDWKYQAHRNIITSPISQCTHVNLKNPGNLPSSRTSISDTIPIVPSRRQSAPQKQRAHTRICMRCSLSLHPKLKLSHPHRRSSRTAAHGRERERAMHAAECTCGRLSRKRLVKRNKQVVSAHTERERESADTLGLAPNI